MVPKIFIVWGYVILKCKTLLSLTLCVLLVTALSATAFAEAAPTCTVSGPQNISTGDTIQIVMNGDNAGMIDGFVQTSGLSYVDVSVDIANEISFTLMPTGDLTELIYTYTVTAQPGETASFSATDIRVNNGQSTLPNTGWSAVVAGATASEEPSEQPTDSSGSQTAPPAATGTTGSSGTSSTGGSGSNTASGSANKDRIPKTGDATTDLWVLAVLACGCSGLALIAARKAFSR